jgi:hypothetical protein
MYQIEKNEDNKSWIFTFPYLCQIYEKVKYT